MPKILIYARFLYATIIFLKDQPLELDISGINYRQPGQVVGARSCNHGIPLCCL